MSALTIEHGCARATEQLVPVICKLVDISTETSDVKAFRVQTLDGQRPFDCSPGQTAMLSVIPYGECMFCVSAQGEDYLEFTVKRVGYVTEQLHALTLGDTVGLRGPYGNWFPTEGLKGKDVLFVGGGIGLAPLRALLTYLLDHRESYGRIDLVYSGSTRDDLLFLDDIFHVWPKQPDVHMHTSVYRESADWSGEVSYTAPYLEKLAFSPEGRVAVLCGGPSLFRTCLASLLKLGFDPGSIITTLEMRMKCGIGKCGRCNVGSKYICLDGPVFTMAELEDLPWSAD
ncbi:MAG: FAD/NAD(P)-binding protein [Coriobacteriales bacterium]|jgi:NAD(P)H-flavin reductase|nr:FAD/NAD(P)-binding protein [Coriobacteriales bacterium]